MNPLSKYGVSDDDIKRELRESAEVDNAINDFMEKQVVAYWRGLVPQWHEYNASVKVTKKAKRGKGRVAATVWYAHFIEFGTGVDEKGPERRRILTKKGWVTLPKKGKGSALDTPTKAYALGERTARHFGGHLGEGIAADLRGDDA